MDSEQRTTADERTSVARGSGSALRQRKLQRRRRLLDAALHEFFKRGYHGTSVRRICMSARLSTRQFYELFGSREQLLAELYGSLTAEYQAAVLAAIEGGDGTLEDALQRGVGAMWDRVTRSRAEGYLLFVACVGVSPELEDQRRAVVHSWADLIVGIAAASTTPMPVPTAAQAKYIALGVVGAANELFVDWILGDGQMDPDDLHAALLWVHRRLLTT